MSRGLVVAVLWLAACSGTRDRQAVIIQTLVDADRELAQLRPVEVAAKYTEMAKTPQAFMRGTAGVFYRDLTRDVGDGMLVHGEGAELVQLYGDVHLENVGATFDAQGMLLDVIDYDATVRGPFAWDVRRAALAVVTAADMAGRDLTLQETLARALATGWHAALGEVAAGNPPWVFRTGAAGKIFDDLLEDAAERRAEREELSRYTEVTAAGRRILHNDELREMPPQFRAGLADALARYRTTRKGGPIDASALTILDAAQRFGAGVASLPNLRFYVLLAGDVLLELKEQRDPPLPIGWLGHGPTSPLPFGNAARVLDGTKALLASASTDPELGVATIEGVSFQVRSVSRARRDLDVPDLVSAIQRGKYDASDLTAMAGVIGQLMACGHARTADPIAMLRAAGGSSGFAARVGLDALADHARLLSDLELFRAALVGRGPLLGARP